MILYLIIFDHLFSGGEQHPRLTFYDLIMSVGFQPVTMQSEMKENADQVSEVRDAW